MGCYARSSVKRTMKALPVSRVTDPNICWGTTTDPSWMLSWARIPLIRPLPYWTNMTIKSPPTFENPFLSLSLSVSLSLSLCHLSKFPNLYKEGSLICWVRVWLQRIKLMMCFAGGTGAFSAVNPKVCWPSVKNNIELLRWWTNIDCSSVLGLH